MSHTYRGWQVVSFTADREEPTSFRYELCDPVVYCDKNKAERARIQATQRFLRVVLTDLADHVDGYEGKHLARDLFENCTEEEQKVFLRAFAPGVWKTKREGDKAYKEALKVVFDSGSFNVPERASREVWRVAGQLFDPYIPQPILRAVKVVTEG